MPEYKLCGYAETGIIMISKITMQAFWLLVFLGWLLLCFWLSFQINSFFDYFFSFFYDFYGINEHIQTYAPQNKYKLWFDQVSSKEHIHLFSQIVDAVHQRSVRLQDITYNAGGVDMLFLTDAEVVHLNDVKILIHKINQAVLFIIPATVFPFLFLLNARHYPNWYAQGLGLLLLSVLVILTLSIVGSEKVFYQFHHWVFPDNHQWFFYYQESLMSTLMKAPTLFAGIAWVILLFGLLFFAALVWLVVSYQAKQEKQEAALAKARARNRRIRF